MNSLKTHSHHAHLQEHVEGLQKVKERTDEIFLAG